MSTTVTTNQASAAAALGALPIEPAADLADLLRDAPAPADRFRVTDEKSADWVLGKLADLDAAEARIKANAAQRVKEIQADRSRLLSRFEAELKAFGEQEKENRRRKTITLMNGVLTFREIPAAMRLVDADAALPHALSLGLTVQIPAIPAKVEIDRDAYVKRAEENGEALPGVEYVAARETFKITAGTKQKESAAVA